MPSGLPGRHRRGFLPGEEKSGHDSVVVLSHGLWLRRFGGDRGLIGRSIIVNGEKRTVVGVMPADFEPVSGEELWLPLAFSAEDLRDRGRSSLHVLARLRQGINQRKAQSEVDALAAQLRWHGWSRSCSPRTRPT